MLLQWSLQGSGIAEPDNILKVLPYYKGPSFESIFSVCILDALRLQELYEVITPLISKQIEHSSLVLINKADAASQEQIEEARSVAQSINPNAKTIAASLLRPLSEELLAEVLPWLD